MATKKKADPIITDLGLSWVGISVGVNGYTVSVEGEPPDDLYVFKSWAELSTWLFNNVAKPEEAETN